MEPAVGSIIANRFELVRELGHGSMGSVWLAEHLTLDVRCAVKFMTNEARRDPNYAARFELEARTIAQIQCPNVVRVLDYDFDDGVPFIAMECLQGEDLAARIQREGRLDAATTHRILAQVARGLDKAHAASVIHRDLKPENIFLAQEDDGEVAKLLDFGIAKLTGLEANHDVASATLAGTLLGTPVYMSPEQVRAVGDLDYRADLWSLAVIAFECLTGQLPFQSPTLGDLFAKILFEPIPVPSEVDASCTPEFDEWFARAASRTVSERFSSAPEMIEALGRVLGVVREDPGSPDPDPLGLRDPAFARAHAGAALEARHRGPRDRPRAPRGHALQRGHRGAHTVHQRGRRCDRGTRGRRERARRGGAPAQGTRGARRSGRPGRVGGARDGARARLGCGADARPHGLGFLCPVEDRATRLPAGRRPGARCRAGRRGLRILSPLQRSRSCAAF
jgi:serine/threonine protein kinase